MSIRGLSKSKIISGLQCLKRLYLQVHQPELAETSEQAERLINFGYRVQEVARGLHPDGKLVGHESAVAEAIRQTSELLQEPGDRLLFEPAFQHIGVAVRADLFSRHHDQYRLNEVKASTEVKDYYYNDIAIQRWVIEGAGYPLRSTIVSHIDNQFVYQGDGDYQGLFKEVDITEETEPLQEMVPAWIKDLRKMLAGPLPEIAMGKQCSDPFECEFQQFCSRGLPKPEYPVSVLPYGGKTVEKLLAKGYTDLRDVPENELSNQRHKWVWRATKTGEPGLDPRVREIVRKLPYPRFYLDFETAQFAVPIWAGTRPYEQLPFQWSCHIESEGGVSTHKEFINVTREPPIRQFAESLIAALGEHGAIVVWGSFEGTRLRELAARFPDLEVRLMKIVQRINDLLPIAQNHYYHRDMQGSWSLKCVLPTIAPDLDYSKLGEVQEGSMAQTAYLEAIDPETPPERREKLVNSLREYCKMDTLALVRIARFFASS